MAKVTLYLVRHGQTDWNVRGILQGQTDTELTAEGIAQARLIAEKFRDQKLDAIYASDLTRARETARIIAEPHGVEVKTTPLIRERKFGQLEGKTANEVRTLYGEQFEREKSMTKNQKLVYRLVDDMESDLDLVNRLTSFLKQVVVESPDTTGLAVTHGGVMRTFLYWLDYAPHQQLTTGAIKNTGYIKVETDGEMFTIVETDGVDLRSDGRTE